MNVIKIFVFIMLSCSCFGLVFAGPEVSILGAVDNKLSFSTNTPCFEVPLSLIESQGEGAGQVKFWHSWVKSASGQYKEIKSPIEFHKGETFRCGPDAATWQETDFSTNLIGYGREEVWLAGQLKTHGRYVIAVSLEHECGFEHYLVEIDYVPFEADYAPIDVKVRAMPNPIRVAETVEFEIQLEPDVKILPFDLATTNVRIPIDLNSSPEQIMLELHSPSLDRYVESLKEEKKEIIVDTKPIIFLSSKALSGAKKTIPLTTSLDTEISGLSARIEPFTVDYSPDRIQQTENLIRQLGNSFWLVLTNFLQTSEILGIANASEVTDYNISSEDVPKVLDVEVFEIDEFGRNVSDSASNVIEVQNLNSKNRSIAEVTINLTSQDSKRPKTGEYSTMVTFSDTNDRQVEPVQIPVTFFIKDRMIWPGLLTFLIAGIIALVNWRIRSIDLEDELDVRYKRSERRFKDNETSNKPIMIKKVNSEVN